MPDHPFREVVFPNVQPESSLAQLEAIPSSPITSHTREEADLQLTTTSLQVVREINNMSLAFQYLYGDLDIGANNSA